MCSIFSFESSKHAFNLAENCLKFILITQLASNCFWYFFGITFPCLPNIAWLRITDDSSLIVFNRILKWCIIYYPCKHRSVICIDMHYMALNIYLPAYISFGTTLNCGNSPPLNCKKKLQFNKCIYTYHSPLFHYAGSKIFFV